MMKLTDLLTEQNKKFNSRTVKPGELYDESDVYSYVQRVHSNQDDFESGNLGNRIEKYKKYKVENVDLSKLNLDRFEIHPEVVKKYEEQYKKYGAYLPIVISHDYKEIIDGNHRANALNNIGLTKILSFVGQKK